MFLLSGRKPICWTDSLQLPVLTNPCTSKRQEQLCQIWQQRSPREAGLSNVGHQSRGHGVRVPSCDCEKASHAGGYRQGQKIICGKLSLHSKTAEVGIITGLQSRSLCRKSIFDLPKWSLLVVICHKPHPDGREIKVSEFRIDLHSLACSVHISLWTCLSTICVFWRKHWTNLISRDYLWLGWQLFWTQGTFLVYSSPVLFALMRLKKPWLANLVNKMKIKQPEEVAKLPFKTMLNFSVQHRKPTRFSKVVVINYI